MNTLHTLTLTGALLAGLCSSLADAACTDPVDPAGVQLQAQQQNGVTYLSGGIGLDEACALQRMPGYDLHMTFSEGTGNKYVPVSHIAIQNAQGHEVLDVNDVGPLLLAQLPAGRYVVIAQHDGREARGTVEVATGKANTLNLHWKDAN